MNRLAIFITVLVSIGLNTYTQTFDKEDLLKAEEYYKIAEKYFGERSFDSALVYYKKSLRHCRGLPDSCILEGQCLVQLGNVYNSIINLDSSHSYINNGISWLRKHYPNNYNLQANAFYIKGHVFYKYNMVDSSDYYLNKSILLCDSIKNDSLYVLLLKAKGNNRFLENEYDYALYYYQKSLNIEQSMKHPSGIILGSIYQNLGIIYSEIYDHENANTCFKKSLKYKEMHLQQDDIILASAYLNYSIFLQSIGDYQNALNFLNKSEKIYKIKSSSNSLSLAHVYSAKSVILGCLSQYRKAISYGEKAITIFRTYFPEILNSIGNTYSTIGSCYVYIKKYDKAIYNLKLAIEYPQKPISYLNTLRLLSICYNELNQDSLSNSYILEEIDFLNKTKNKISFCGAKTYFHYGIFYKKQNEYNIADSLFKKANSIYLEIGYERHPAYLELYRNIADNKFEAKDLKAALEYYQAGIDHFYKNSGNGNDLLCLRQQQFQYFEPMIQLLYGKSRTLNQLNKKDHTDTTLIHKSLETTKIAVRLIEILKDSTNDSYFTHDLSDDIRKIVDLAKTSAIELYNKSGKLSYQKLIFELIEKGKANILLSNLSESKARNLSGIPTKILIEENTIKAELSFCNSKIDGTDFIENAKDSLELDYFKNRRFDLIVRYDSLINHLEDNYPDYYAIKYDYSTASISDIQEELDDKTLMLNFSITDSLLFIASLSDTSYFVEVKKIDNSLSKKIIEYYTSIKTGGSKKIIADLSYELYDFLIRPIEQQLVDKDKLIIIPDEYLSYVPFETLCSNKVPEDRAVRFSELDYLIKDFDITYSYSATIWHRSQNKNLNIPLAQNKQMNFIGYAPVFEKENGNVPIDNEIFSDSTLNELSLRSITLDGKKFNELPYSEKEVTTIAGLFQNLGNESLALIHDDANEKNFKEISGDYSIVHVATHGFSNDEKPDLSGLIFSQPLLEDEIPFEQEKDDFWHSPLLEQSNDGILYASEMYNLDLSADLMVLSACETGVGQLIRGEGMMAMTRGMLYSGVPNVVYTLWRVSDKHSYQLMVEFYKEILSGSSYDHALRMAKLKMIENEKTSFPKLWSGFLLIGN